MDADAIGLAVTLDLDGRKVVLVGDDEEAARKSALLAEAGAAIAQVAASAFTPALLDGAALVLVTPRDDALAAEVHAAARARGVPCWACDRPARSDMAMPALARVGALRLAISTGGRSPALAGRLRAALEDGLGDRFGGFLEALGELRERVQREEPDADRRRELLRAALDDFALALTVRYPDWYK
jgi:precorrin-2 dehydrogenase/sirohydrochlorin ferrochelatase